MSSDMSVSMILKLVDQFSGPAKQAESAAEKFKREMQSLNDIKSGSGKTWFDKATFDQAAQALAKRSRELGVAQRAELEAARAIQQAERAKGESAAAAASQIVAANERIVASEQRTVTAIERSTAQQAAAAASLQRQRSAAYFKEERDREAAAKRHQREQERIEREQRHHGAGAFMLGAGAAAVSAHSIYGVAKRAVLAGAERQHVEVKALNAGIPASEIPRVQAASMEAKRHAPNMSVTEIQEMFTEIRSAVKHPEEVYHILNDLARAGSVLKGAGLDNSGLNLIVKAAESLGRMNSPAQFKAYLDGQVRAMQFFGKTITPEGIYQSAKYMKSASGTVSDHFINMTLPSLTQELRGSSAGDAVSMLLRTLRGRLEHRGTATQLLNDIGMTPEQDKIHRNKAGKIIGYGGKIKGDNLLATDPDRWVWEVFKPAMEAKGIKSLSDQIKFADSALPPQAANLVRVLLQQEEAIKQHQRGLEATADAETAAANQAKEAAASFTALTKSLNDLSAATTQGAMPAIAAGLNKITSYINAAAEAAAAHPTEAAVGGGAAAAVALYTSGRLAFLVASGFGLPAAAGQLTGAAAALDAAAAKLGAGGLLKDVPKAPLPIAPVVPLVGAAGGGAGAAIGGAVVVGIGAGGLAAGAIMDDPDNQFNRTFDGFRPGAAPKREPAPGHRPWTVGRIWRNFTDGGDDMPTAAEINENIERAAAARRAARLPVGWEERAGAGPQLDNSKLDETQQKAAGAKETLERLSNVQAAPNVDTSHLDATISKSNDAHSSLLMINGSFSPRVDTSGLDALIAKTKEAEAGLRRLGVAARGAGAHRSFTPSHGNLHDGNEAY